MKRAPWYVLIGTALVPTLAGGQQSCDELTLTERQRIGSVDGPVSFTAPRDLDLDGRGNIYVTDLWDPGVQVLSPTGEPLRRIGRAGSGPGEFSQSVSDLGWIGDTLWVSDLRAIHYFDTSGLELGQVSFRISVAEEGSAFVPGIPLPDGSFLGRRILTGDIDRYRLAKTLPLLKLSSTGAVLDTIVVVDRPRVVLGERDGSGHLEPIGEHPLYDWHGDSSLPVAASVGGSSVLMVHNLGDEGIDAFDLLRISISGDTLGERRIRYTPKPLTRADKKFLSEGAAALYAGEYSGSRGRLGSAAAARRRRSMSDAIWFPEHYPPVRRIFAGHDGTIWLLREAAPSPVDRWEVYDENLEYEGTLEVDSGRMSPVPWWPRMWLLRATLDELWTYTIDDLEVPYIHRFSISRGCDVL